MSTKNEKNVVISAPKLHIAEFNIVGTAPYVQPRFSEKAMAQMAEKMMEKMMQSARIMHVSTEGWYGIPASAFRNALISACRLVGYKMTLAKLSVFVEADGFDRVDGVPLVKINGTPEPLTMSVRNATGDLRVRAMWREWSAVIRVTFDEDQFSPDDVANLLLRAGKQVGIGEGRPDSKSSAGMGWGTFTIV